MSEVSSREMFSGSPCLWIHATLGNTTFSHMGWKRNGIQQLSGSLHSSPYFFRTGNRVRGAPLTPVSPTIEETPSCRDQKLGLHEFMP